MKHYTLLSLGARFLLLCGIIVCLACTTSTLANADDLNKDTPKVLPLEEAMAQSFSVSVISSRYGSFNATFSLKSSINFPERLHGQFIPIGEQRRQLGERHMSLEHFDLPRPLSLEMPPSELDPHPSLLSIEIEMDFSGGNSGKLRLWAFPAQTRQMEKLEAEIESGDAAPTASASFSFRGESNGVAPSTLSYTESAARRATGLFAIGEGDAGSYTFRFLSEHEFSVSVKINAKDKEETFWVHGYVKPNEAVLSRLSGRQQPWWHAWVLIGMAILVFVLQTVTAIVDAKQKQKIIEQGKSLRASTVPVVENDKKKS